MSISLILMSSVEKKSSNGGSVMAGSDEDIMMGGT